MGQWASVLGSQWTHLARAKKYEFTRDFDLQKSNGAFVEFGIFCTYLHILHRFAIMRQRAANRCNRLAVVGNKNTCSRRGWVSKMDNFRFCAPGVPLPANIFKNCGNRFRIKQLQFTVNGRSKSINLGKKRLKIDSDYPAWGKGVRNYGEKRGQLNGSSTYEETPRLYLVNWFRRHIFKSDWWLTTYV